MKTVLTITESLMPIPDDLVINYNLSTIHICRGDTWYVLQNWDRNIPNFLHFIGVLPDAGLVSLTVDGQNGMVQFDRGIDSPDQVYVADFTVRW